MTKMPTPAEFNAAAKNLSDRGWTLVGTVMVDDAKKPGVINFGRMYTRSGDKFYLNFKTIGNLPV
jgi:hypothetical protein